MNFVGARIPAVILANVNLGDRQVDLVIAIDRAALSTEFRGFTSAVRGARTAIGKRALPRVSGKNSRTHISRPSARSWRCVMRCEALQGPMFLIRMRP